jgi:hypothetical protein
MIIEMYTESHFREVIYDFDMICFQSRISELLSRSPYLYNQSYFVLVSQISVCIKDADALFLSFLYVICRTFQTIGSFTHAI